MSRERKHTEDEAGVGPDPRLTRHLLPLKELPRYRIARGEPDIRGWSIYTSNGREVGAIVDLLVDPSIGEAVMLDLAVQGAESGRRTVAPIRAAWIDREHKRVILDSAQLMTNDEELTALGREIPADEEAKKLDEYQGRLSGEHARQLPNPATPGPVLAPGSEVVIARHVVSADEPSWGAGSGRPVEGPRDAQLPPEARTPNHGRTLVEEVVVRRRYVDAAELADRGSEKTAQP